MLSFFGKAPCVGVVKGMDEVSRADEPVTQSDLLLRMSELLCRARERSMRPAAVQEPDEGFDPLDGYRFRLSPRRYFAAKPAAK